MSAFALDEDWRSFASTRFVANRRGAASHVVGRGELVAALAKLDRLLRRYIMLTGLWRRLKSKCRRIIIGLRCIALRSLVLDFVFGRVFFRVVAFCDVLDIGLSVALR